MACPTYDEFAGPVMRLISDALKVVDDVTSYITTSVHIRTSSFTAYVNVFPDVIILRISEPRIALSRTGVPTQALDIIVRNAVLENFLPTFSYVSSLPFLGPRKPSLASIHFQRSRGI